MQYKESKLVPILGYIYLVLPVAIFCFGWLKWYFALIFGITLLVCGFFIHRRIKPIQTPIPNTKRDWVIVLTSILFILFVVIISGISNNSAQTNDQFWRNTIFTELINEPWPASMTNDGKTIYLVYYIGYYLPAALFGKMFGISAGFAFLGLWGVFGLVILWLLFCSYYKKITLWPLVMFLFFSGISWFFMLLTEPTMSISFYNSGTYGNAYFYQQEWIYNSNALLKYCLTGPLAEIFWTYNQGFPMLVALGLIFLGKQRHDIILFTALLILPSTLTCFGFAILIMVMMISKPKDDCLSFELIHTKKDFIINLKEYVLTPSLGLSVVTVFMTAFYVLSNTHVGETGGGGKLFIISNPFANNDALISFLIFIIFVVGIYFIYCFRYEKKNPLFYTSILFIIIFVNIRIFGSPDFMLKSPKPLFLYIALLFTESIRNDIISKKRFWLSVGLTIFLLGAVSPLIEILRLFYFTFELYIRCSLSTSYLFTYIGLFLITIILALIIYYVIFRFNDKKYIKQACVCLIGLVSVVVFLLIQSYVIKNGMDVSVWNESADPWIYIYGGDNFSGDGSSFFYKYLARL